VFNRLMVLSGIWHPKERITTAKKKRTVDKKVKMDFFLSFCMERKGKKKWIRLLRN